MAMLERSKTAPLTVLMGHKLSYGGLLPVLEHLSRIKSLTIDNLRADKMNEMHAFIQHNSSVAPQLEVLSISCYWSRDWRMPSTAFQQTDRLHDLSLKQVSIKWSDSPLLRNLTKLRIQLSNHPPTWRELLTALNQMPTLKSLFLSETFPEVPFNDARDAVVARLPNLENLVLRSVPNIDGVMAFMTQVKLPPDLKVFTIVDIGDGPSSEEFRELYHTINRSLPRLGSKVRYMNIARVSLSDTFGHTFIECSSTLRNKFHEWWHSADLRQTRRTLR
ncbi:hypothetical protein D9619_001883 [Psilocybe cf. subviscida]|uniref:F-box domain-containing protein n=1 Tax=Psilocybe cf. subviscida TaxID=2480587 RepID=A0A8H5F290_9AGAR|nr:hypothetical protein D9619_001883 [Psilocybe cf. subviscida]